MQPYSLLERTLVAKGTDGKEVKLEARRDICTLKDDIFGFGSCFA